MGLTCSPEGPVFNTRLSNTLSPVTEISLAFISQVHCADKMLMNTLSICAKFARVTTQEKKQTDIH